MVKIKRIVQGLVGVIFLFVGTHAYAATYYFSTAGNNSTGLGTQASPFYSLCGPWANSGCTTGENKISRGQIGVNPGDQLLFKRGEEWKGIDATWTINAMGTLAAPIVFGAYGDPSLPRPIFRGAKSAYELGKDSWTNVSGTPIWYVSGINWTPVIAAQEDSAPDGPHLWGALSVQGITNANGYTLDQSMVRGTFYYESSTQRLYVWRTDGLKPDHAAGRDIFIGNSPTDGTERLVKVNRGYGVDGGYYTFQDLHVKMSSRYGFSTSYRNTQFINCLSELNGFEGFLFDRRRFGAPVPAAKDGVMRNCVSRRNNMGQGSGIGQGITIESENVWVYDTESYENGYAGIDFLDYHTATKTDGGGIVNSKFHNNSINPTYMVNIDPNIYIDGGSNITIRDTQVWAAGIDPRGVKTRLRPSPGIAIDLEGSGFAAGKRPTNIQLVNVLSYGNAGPALRIGAINGNQSTPTFSNIKVIGSTLARDRGDNDIKGYYDINQIDQGIRVFGFNGISSGLVFKNNLVAATNTGRAPIFGSKSMYDTGKSAMDFDNNIYYCPSCNFNTTGGFGSGGFYSYNYISNMTIDQFRNVGAAANLLQDQTLSKTVITSNPLMTNLAANGFDGRLLSNSPAIDVAMASAFPFTMTGTTRADGASDNPYNDLGYHYPLTGAVPPPPPVDTQAPTAPSGLTATQLPSSSNVALAWLPSVDNVAVAIYQIFDTATLLGTTASTGYTLLSAVPGHSYNFLVKALDSANNTSSPSNTVTLTVGAPSDTTPPTAPTGLTAVVAGSQVTLSWTASTDNVGVVGYEIMNNGQLLGTSVSTTFVHNGTAGSTYNYTVRAGDASNNMSASSTIVTVTTPAATPSGPGVPTNLIAAYTSGQVQLSWGAASGSVGYNIYRNNVYLKVVTATSSFDNSVGAGNSYAYKVEAFDASNNKSSFSNVSSITVPSLSGPDSVAPSIPYGMTAVYSAGNILMNWPASTDNVGVAMYKVINDPTQIATSAVNSYTVLSPPPGSTYKLVVQACDAVGNCSWWGNKVTVIVPTGPAPDTTAPSTPANLSAILNGTALSLTWSASTDNVAVTGYQILNNNTVLGTSISPSFIFNSAAAGQSYSFTVKAYDAANNTSLASNMASVTVPPAPDAVAPSVPANLSASLSGTSATLSWTASTDNVAVTGYQVFDGAALSGTTSSLVYSATGLSVGSHTFTVKARDAANNTSAASNTAVVTVASTAPGTPANLIAFMSGSSVSVAWSSATNAAGYSLYRNGTSMVNVTSTSMMDSSVTVGQTYSYQVLAFNSAGVNSGLSNAMSVTVPLPPDTTAPSVPASLSAVLSGTTANLSWGASTDNVAVAGYRVYQAGSLKGTASSNSYAVTGLTEGQTYSFTVQALDAANNLSGLSNTASVSVPLPPPGPDTQIPTPPYGMTAVYSAGNILMNWPASTDNVGVAMYKVINDPTQIATSAVNSYTVLSPPPGSTYKLVVQACDAAGNCSWWGNKVTVIVPTGPAPDTTAPSTPANLSAILNGTALSLTWSASTDNVAVTGYQVFQGATFYGTSTATSYSVSGLIPSLTYSFTVKSIDAAGNISASSNTVTVTVPGTEPAPAVPGNFLVSSGGSGNIDISWSPSAGAVSYNLYRNGTLLISMAGGNYSEHPGGGTWIYKVQAVNASGVTSAFTPEVSVRTNR